MPLSKYNYLFNGGAEKTYRQMIARYGEKRGKEVFYATINKRRRAKGR